MNKKNKEIISVKKVSSFKLFMFIFMCTFIGFGGGNALLPIISKLAVSKYKWLTLREFDDVVLISNMVPGPSVVQTLSYVAIKLLGFWKGFIVSILAFIPHLVFALVIFILLNKYATKYLYILATCVLPVIIGVLINFGYDYLKQSYKNINFWLINISFILTLCFCLFVPSPYNIPAFPLLAGLFLIFLVIKIKKVKELDKNKGVKK